MVDEVAPIFVQKCISLKHSPRADTQEDVFLHFVITHENYVITKGGVSSGVLGGWIKTGFNPRHLHRFKQVFSQNLLFDSPTHRASVARAWHKKSPAHLFGRAGL